MKKSLKVILGMVIMILAVICLPVAGGVDRVMAQTLEQFEMTVVNPIYEDDLTEGAEDDVNLQAPITNADEMEDDLPIYETLHEAAVEVRRNLVERKGIIQVNFLSTSADHQALVQDVYNEACEHTGVPNEGDYLKWGFAKYNCNIKRSSSNGVYTYYLTYTVTYYTTYLQEAEVTQMIDEILSADEFHDMENYCTWDKIHYIYDYITSHVTYDHEHIDDPDYKLKYTAYAALVDGTSVCQGYSTLMYQMMLKCGVDCRLIAGIGNNENHSWNIVKLGDIYYYTDPTWDAARNGNWTYFLTSSDYFERSHERWAEYKTEEFCEKYPVSGFVFNHDYSVHDYGEAVVTVRPNCSNEGILTFKCKYCEKSYEETLPIDAGEHEYEAVVTKPTPEEDGYTTYTCKFCGDSYISDIVSHEKIYTVVYDGNGATAGSMENQIIIYGIGTPMNANAFAKTGYHFAGWTAHRDSDDKWYAVKTDGKTKGWFTQATIDSNGYKKVIYADQASIAKSTSVDKDVVTMYAQWKANTYTVHFAANGGTGSMNDITVTYGVNKELSANAFKKTGYTFKGWTAYRKSDNKWYAVKTDGTTKGWFTQAVIDANGYTKVVYANKAKLAKSTSVDKDEVTMYAQWKANTFSVVFKANGGTGSMSKMTVTYGVSKALTANAFKRTGYTFKGWYAYRASDSKWYVQDKNGNKLWATASQITSKKYTKVLYANKASIAKTTSVNGDTVSMYAQWKKK